MALEKTSILVVDDDPRLLRMIQLILEAEDYRVVTAINGKVALDTFDMNIPDLVLLDIMMPDIDGFSVCERIREFSQIPIIMVTAKDDDDAKVRGLNAGADDYVTKPFSADVLMARVKAVLRRTKQWEERPEPAFHLKDMVVDFAQHRVTIGGQEVKLTAVEYKLLSYLARNAGRILTPDQILDAVWGDEYIGENQILRVSMTRLRHKLEDDGKSPQYIQTRVGIGYMMIKE